jgi:hypothetical protein
VAGVPSRFIAEMKLDEAAPRKTRASGLKKLRDAMAAKVRSNEARTTLVANEYDACDG